MSSLRYYLALLSAAVAAGLLTPAMAAGTATAVSPVAESHPGVSACQNGLVIPAWRPVTGYSLFERILRGSVYFFSMMYLFIGVSIISDRFMSAIEVITSQEKKVTIRSKGEKKTVLVRVWNETVANLTLMALGSSAPEILLSIIEIYGKNFEAGELGPGTIVGSAAYNLFVIISICVSVIPKGETRKIKHLSVFIITATWSVFAYIWLFLILDVFSKNVVEVWEGLLTFSFFPLTVWTAYLADKKIPIHKYLLCRMKSRRAVGAAERVDIEMNKTEEGSFEEMLEQARVQSANMLKELRILYPDKTFAELKALAQERIELSGPKSRAFYRIQATRSLTGGGSVIQRHARESSVNDEREDVQDIFDDNTYVRFEEAEIIVLENVGTIVVKVVLEGPGLNVPLLVDYQSEDGTANAGSDYMAVAGTLQFKPGQNEQCFKIKIIDDDVFEEDEHFYVKLCNVRVHGAKQNGLATYKLGDPSVLKVTILDDDHSGVFSFPERRLEVSENVGVLHLPVERRTGSRGRVRLGYRSQDETGKAGRDYQPVSGILYFENNESRKTIQIPIVSQNCYERNSSFTVHLENPSVEISEDGPRNSFKMMNHRSEEEERIAKEGFPTIGENSSITVVIKESLEFKDAVDQLVETRASPFIIGTKSWGEQFAAVFRVKEDGEEADPSSFDYFMHVLTFFWKFIFAFVPPTDFCCGYVCFTLSIVCIGLLTAVIGDVASHFGCTVGLQDAVTAITFVALGTSVPEFLHGWICFCVSIFCIGVLTSIIGDVASAFGCTALIPDSLTAITLVAMGTSLPDTFASKVAAIQDNTADNSIGNVTGSNAVNVFLGIGIAWSLAALHHFFNGTQFTVPSGNLAFSVTIFCSEALIAIFIILIRRCKPIGGELGGPMKIKYATSVFFFLLWVLYITLSTLEVYDVIEGF